MKKNRLLIIAIVVAISLFLLIRMNFRNRTRETYQVFDNSDIEGIITRIEPGGGFVYVTIGDSTRYDFFSINHDLSKPSFLWIG